MENENKTLAEQILENKKQQLAEEAESREFMMLMFHKHYGFTIEESEKLINKGTKAVAEYEAEQKAKCVQP